MNTARGAMVGAVLLGASAAYAVGCGTAYEDLVEPLLDPGTAVFADGGTGGHDGGTGGTGGHDGGTGGTGGGNPGCAGDPTKDPTVVADNCGVFVSAGAAPGGNGKKATPFQTFAEAAATKPSRIYACAGTYAETGQVSFTGGVEIYGGFTGCTPAGWTWADAMEAQITTAPDVPGVVLNGGANKIENVSVTAPAATMPGGSSIAVLVNGGSLDATNAALAAGDAQDGAAATSLMPDPALDGATGAGGVDACNTGLTSPGAMGSTNTCITGGSSTAGSGGDGGDATGDPAGSGVDGSAVPPATALGMADGKGGSGEGEKAAPLCTTGNPGAPGTAGSSGGGATGPGAISATGYQGASGVAGGNGMPGQGGGGGGAAKGAMSITCNAVTTPRLGASGGAGGTGGCGGNGGGAGQPGGSSIALLVLDAEVMLTNVTLTASKGGNGGAGGNGQSGGHGGSGGAKGTGTGSLNDACPGGDGGKGGVGGPGGGGQGGHSLGIAFQGTMAPTGGTFTITMTNAGTGGPGGTGNATTNAGQGANGIAENCWDFGADAACK